MMWEETKLGQVCELGVSSHVLNDDLLLLCGGAQHKSQGRYRQWLQCRTLVLSSLKWKLLDVNTGGAPNRSYHAAVTMNNRAYLFGGILDSSSHVADEKLAGDCVVCSISQEGVSCRAEKHEVLHRYGWSAVAAGTQSDAIVLFGGKDAAGVCTSDTILCKVGPEGMSYEVLPCEGERPAPRCFYAAAVTGPQQQYLVVCGGHDGRSALSDIWVLDFSNGLPEVIAAKEAEAKDTKAKAPKKGEAPPFAWVRLNIDDVIPRSLHFCSVTRNSAGSEILRVFGGIGVSSLEIHESVLDLKTVDNRVQATAKPFTTLQGSEQRPGRYGFSIAAIPSEEGDVGSYLLLGGSANSTGDDGDVLAYTLGANTAFAAALSAHHADIKEQEEAAALAAMSLQESELDAKANTEVTYDNGDVYDGQLNDEGLRHGEGSMRYANGDFYEGHWESGLRHGSGRLDFADGNSIYQGFFDHGVMQGFGRLVLRSENRAYEGEFINGAFHGQGQLTNKDGVYEGQFEYGKRHGTGKLTREGEVIYDGQWAEDEPCGYGRLVMPLHEAYAAEQAKYLESMGIVACGQYEGSLLHGKPHGHGICRYVNDEVYDGAWKNGRRNGFGSYTCYTGHMPSSVYKGKWVANERSGHGVLTSTSGYCYDGAWARDKPHGSGKEVYNSGGECYEGEFQSGERHGYGKMTRADGSVLEGKWIHGKLHTSSSTPTN